MPNANYLMTKLGNFWMQLTAYTPTSYLILLSYLIFQFTLIFLFSFSSETIEQDAVRLFEDVVEDFSSVGGALRKFNQWRTEDKTAYCEAYVSITLPRILAPFIRLDLVSWNPLLAVSLCESFYFIGNVRIQNMFLSNYRKKKN